MVYFQPRVCRGLPLRIQGCDVVEFGLGAFSESGITRQVLARVVGVLVGAALPGAAGGTEVDRDTASDGEGSVLCASLVGGSMPR